MTIKKLLAGASLAALVAGASHAQEATLGTGDFTGQVIASEYTGDIEGDLVLDFALEDAFAGMGAGGAVTAKFTLTNAVFSATVPNSAWTAAADAECNFGAPSLGGGVGGDSVSFENQAQLNLCDGSDNDPSSPTAADADNGFLTLPIEVEDNSLPVSVRVEFTPTADAGTYTGSDESIDVLDNAELLSFDIDFDDTATPPVGQFDADGDDLNGSGVIGRIVTVFNNGTGGVNEGFLGGGTSSASTLDDVVASLDVILTFPEGVEGIDEANVGLNTAACTQGVAPADNVFTCSVTGGGVGSFGSETGTITIDDDGDTETGITTQTPTVAIEFTAATDFAIDDVADTDIAPLELDDGLGENEIDDSDFAWTRIGSGGTESNFRVALASDLLSSNISEVYVNCGAGNGPEFGTDGVITLLPSEDPNVGFRTKGNVLSFTSAGLGDAAGASGNCDIDSVELQYDEDELLASDVSGAGISRLLVTRNDLGLSDL